MKKNKTIVGVTLMLFTLMLSGCINRGNRLYIYNWTYYTPHSILEKFEKEYGVKIYYDEYDSNEAMYAKIKAGGSGYDLVFPSADYVSIMIKQNMLEPIDKSLLTNLDNIDPEIYSIISFDPHMEYSIPYYYGTSGIAVNTLRVSEYEKSWSIFSRKDLKGKMTMLDDYREVIGGALAYLGYSVNTANPAEIEEASELVNTEWKPNLIKFDSEAFGKGFADNNFWVAQGYAEAIFEELSDDSELRGNIEFFVPEEGGPSYLDSMCILKGSKNIEMAHKFIDFIHRPEIYAEFTDYFAFPSTVNVPARQYKKVTPYYEVEALHNTEMMEDVGEALDFYNRAWFNTIRIGGE